MSVTAAADNRSGVWTLSFDRGCICIPPINFEWTKKRHSILIAQEGRKCADTRSHWGTAGFRCYKSERYTMWWGFGSLIYQCTSIFITCPCNSIGRVPDSYYLKQVASGCCGFEPRHGLEVVPTYFLRPQDSIYNLLSFIYSISMLFLQNPF